MIEDLEALVSVESPSDDLAATAAGARAVASVGERLLGVPPEVIVIDGRTHLRWSFGGPTKVLLLGHQDTVWPLGTLARKPFAVSADGVATGPGCFDMKAGLVQALHALSTVDDRDGVTFLVTSDEEIGSPTSRELIEKNAAGAAACLVMEGSADGGGLKTGRAGTSNYSVEITGLAAHAGLEPHRGVNATIELAHQVLALTGLASGSTTVTPTVARSGTTTNTVAASAEVAVDVRARTAVEQNRVDAAIRALRPVVPGASLVVNGGINRPPLETTASASLFALAQQISPGLASAEVGGASDGNFTAGLGVPTLDGLGAVGGGAHAEHEHVLVSAMHERSQLLAALITELLSARQR
ncbi:M20 family metallopeptidase [Allokutzneria oryzae]|uniref:M20 family metallopeptidase n=1 Tax=Allokutzneria oryzae TaxID=1378989 RepID=A0ABV5ZXP8_9PSEU